MSWQSLQQLSNCLYNTPHLFGETWKPDSINCVYLLHKINSRLKACSVYLCFALSAVSCRSLYTLFINYTFFTITNTKEIKYLWRVLIFSIWLFELLVFFFFIEFHLEALIQHSFWRGLWLFSPVGVSECCRDTTTPLRKCIFSPLFICENEVLKPEI